MNSVHCWRAVLALAVLISGLAGCGGNTKKAAQESSNLKPLAIIYGRFVGRHQGKPPASEAELKEFAKTEADENFLKQHTLPNVDAMFVSSRDNQPYVVIYGALPPAAPPPAGGPTPGDSMAGFGGGAPVIAYEKTGVGGKRYVATSLGAVAELDEKHFQDLVTNPK